VRKENSSARDELRQRHEQLKRFARELEAPPARLAKATRQYTPHPPDLRQSERAVEAASETCHHPFSSS